MKIAYLTIDEVNQDLAQRLAAEFDIILDPRWPKEWPPPVGCFDAQIIDLDFLPPSDQQRILKQLLAVPPPYPVAVHSHNLNDHAAALRANGIAVYRNLARDTFIALCLACGQITAANRLAAAEREREPVAPPESVPNVA